MGQVEFLNLSRVIQICGISKSEIYRKVRSGSFPKSHPYRDSPTRRFWLSTEIASWQQSQIDVPLDGGDFDGLL